MTAREEFDESIRKAIEKYEEDSKNQFHSLFVKTHKPAGFQSEKELIIDLIFQ